MSRLLDDKGVISIEACLVLPIVIIILLNFICLTKYLIVCEEIDLTIKTSMIDEQLNEYGKEYVSFSNNVKSKIIKTIKENNMLKNVKNVNVHIEEANDSYDVSIDYDYKDMFLNIKCNSKSAIKKLGEGKSLEEYGFASETYYTEDNIWNLSNIVRGNTISKMLGGNLKTDGSKIDALENNTLKSIVSIDVRKESYSNLFDIYDVIKKDVDKLYNFNEGSVGSINITKSMYDKKQIVIVIPDIELSTYYKNEFLLVRGYCNRKDIQCKFVKIEGK